MNKKNISSGTQKAEALADNTTPKKTTKTAAKTTTKKPAAKTADKKSGVVKSAKKKKPVKHVSEKRQKKIEAHKQKKLEMAKIRAEKKQKRLEKKLEAKQKKLDRIAAVKNAREERKAKKAERRDLLKHESKEARIERKKQERNARIEARVAKREAYLADKRAKREHRLKVQAEKRAERSEKRRTPGFGGWLAAVISLGVTTLALGTMLTFGWLNMNGMQADVASIHSESLYELNSVVDNLDGNLSKARVSSSKNEQVRILTDIAIESEIAETIIERLPLDITMTNNLTSFVNKMGDSAQSMLFAVASGKQLSDSQIASIEYMYKYNLELKQFLNELTAQSTPKQMLEAMSGKKGNLMFETFGEIENKTIETPKEINDGPFAENIDTVSAKALDGLEEISAAKAEELAKQYFSDYGVKSAECTGETTAKQLTLYNVTLSTKDGDMHAQLSKQGGKVVEFNSYKDCNDKNFSVERCTLIAEDFLKSLGIENMKAVWSSENGTTCNLNFAYEQDGVIIYSDMIKLKVCEQRGIVTGMEGLSYVLNHTQRTLPDAKLNNSEAKAKLADGFESEGSRLTLIPLDGNEVLCYEFFGTYGGNDYYIYIDARTGEETQIFTVVGTKQGKALM